MSDEASSSAVAQETPERDGGGEAVTAAQVAERKRKRRQLFNQKRGDGLDDVLLQLDVLVYAELTIIYYMDCSFLRFIMRAVSQFIYLTPKSAVFPEPPGDRPVIGWLLTINALCVFSHLWFDAPAAGDATRGYLHGGMAMDFIGQQGPTSKFHLILLDLLIVSLQLVQLAAALVRRRLRGSSNSSSPQEAQTTPPQDARQDLDSEERGVRRSDEQQDIEMQTLNPSGTSAASDNPNAERDNEIDPAEEDELIASSRRMDFDLFDVWYSGQIVLADLDIWKHVKEQFQMLKELRHAPAPSSQSLRGELAARFLRMRMGTDALRETL